MVNLFVGHQQPDDGQVEVLDFVPLEVRQRMDRNRELALERRAQRLKEQALLENLQPRAQPSSQVGWRMIQKREDPPPTLKRTLELPAAPASYLTEKRIRVSEEVNEARPQQKAGHKAQAAVPQSKPGGTLSAQQAFVLKALTENKSVFLTGSAGTGKSYLVAAAKLILLKSHRADSIYITASTGLAAVNIQGMTLHSFAGVGLGCESKEELLFKVMKKREAQARWMKTKVLIIDEISMIEAELFDKIEWIARQVRKTERSFGGIQLIVMGDFFQLPPVQSGGRAKNFCFEAASWSRCFHLQVELTTVFRQEDEIFVHMLNEIRKGRCSEATLARLRRCNIRPPVLTDGIEYTRLYPLNVDVRRENEMRLASLRADELTFTAQDMVPNEFFRKQLDSFLAVRSLTLKIGAQVVLLKNVDPASGLANGARGVVVAFEPVTSAAGPQDPVLSNTVSPDGRWPLVHFANGVERMVVPESWSVTEGQKEIAKRVQVPLALAWALSVHKSQGMTLDRVETDLSKAFDTGMVYVALSRVRSLEGLYLTGFDPTKIKVNPRVVQFYDDLKSQSMPPS